MSLVEPLPVTLELPASEFMDHEGGLMVRCPLTRAWVPLADYYSENQGQLLPLVGNAEYHHDGSAWENGVKVQGEPIHWKETVRILAPEAAASPEGGIVELNAADAINTAEKGP